MKKNQKSQKSNQGKNVSSKSPLFFVVFVLVVVGIVYFTTTKKQPEYKLRISSQDTIMQTAVGTDEELLMSRKQIYNEYLNEAKAIIKATNDPEGKEVIQFIEKHSKIYLPVAVGVRPLEPVDTMTKLAVVVILKGEVVPGNNWNIVMSNVSAGAMYNAGLTTIIMREDDSLSLRLKGMMFLHEGKHARDNFFELHDAAIPEVLCKDEAVAHMFQNNITAKLYGKPYAELLKKEIVRIKRDTDTSSAELGFYFPFALQYNTGLDAVMGPAASPREESARQIHFQLDAIFRFIDIYFKEDKLLQKARVYDKIAVQNKQLPPHTPF